MRQRPDQVRIVELRLLFMFRVKGVVGFKVDC